MKSATVIDLEVIDDAAAAIVALDPVRPDMLARLAGPGSATTVDRPASFGAKSGFGSGQPWDDQYDQLGEGWKLSLLDLRLHLTHFSGQTATANLPMAMWSGPKANASLELLHALGLHPSPSVGCRVDMTASDAPTLGGTVVEADSWRLAILLDLMNSPRGS